MDLKRKTFVYCHSKILITQHSKIADRFFKGGITHLKKVTQVNCKLFDYESYNDIYKL